MTILPKNADDKVRRYFEYYSQRLQGQPVEEIAQALGFWWPEHPSREPSDLYADLKSDGFPVCEVCGETPASIGHCGELEGKEKLSLLTEDDLPKLARRRLEDLRDEGLSVKDQVSGAMQKQGVATTTGKRAERSIITSKAVKDAKPLRLPDGRTAWVSLHPWEERRYRAPRVMVEPSKSDRAILAALTILDAEPVDQVRVPLIYHLRKMMFQTGINQSRLEELARTAQKDRRLEDLKVSDFINATEIEFHRALLTHYRRRSDFDDLPDEERTALLQRLCGFVNELLEAARKLQAFLEFGSKRGLPTKLVEDIERCLLAAELKDALGLSYREVGMTFGVPLHQDYYALKGYNKRDVELVKRGRNLYKQLLGDEVLYERHLEAVKPALKRSYAKFHEAIRAEDVEYGAKLIVELEAEQDGFLSVVLSKPSSKMRDMGVRFSTTRPSEDLRENQ